MLSPEAHCPSGKSEGHTAGAWAGRESGWTHLAGFHRSSQGEWGGAQAVGESWQLHAWAAVSPTCLVEGALRHLGEPVLPCSGCREEPALPALTRKIGSAPLGAREGACARQPGPTLGRRRRPRPCPQTAVVHPEQRDPHGDRGWGEAL